MAIKMRFGQADDIAVAIAGCPIRGAREPGSIDPVTGELIPFRYLCYPRAGLSGAGGWNLAFRPASDDSNSRLAANVA